VNNVAESREACALSKTAGDASERHAATANIARNNEKSARRDANTARFLCRRGPSSISVPNLKRIALFVQKLLGIKNFEIGSHDPGHAHLGVVLYSLHRRVVPPSLYRSNLTRIAQFVQKLLRGPEIRKLGHVTPATPT